MAAFVVPADLPPALVLERAADVRLANHTGRAPEDLAFPSSMRAAMEFLGDDWGLDHFQAHGRDWVLDRAMVFAAGVSGEPFAFDWRVRLGTPVCGLDPYDTIVRTAAATGYAVEVHFSAPWVRAVRLPRPGLRGGRFETLTDERVLKLGDPAFRADLATILRRACRQDVEAASHLESALRALNAAPDQSAGS